MQKQSAYIDTLFLHRPSEHGGKCIDDKRDPTNDNDDPTLYLRGMDHAHSAFVNQIDADDNERGVVNECCHYLDAAIAKGHVRIGRPSCDFAGGKGNDERCHVRKIMQRISDKRQASRQNATDDLGDG